MAPVHPCASLYSSACLNNPYAVGHHLFHFWAGSGIPTPIRNHSFLSEGLHTYLEYQFSEKTWGTDYASKLFLTKLREMERDMQAHQETSPDVLKLCQATDERKNTKIPSAKGALFFFMLEQAFCKIIKIDGKEQFHRFLKDYMRVFEQESTSKDRFNKFLETWLENEIGSHVNFLLLCNDNNWWNWFYGTEIPENAPTQFQTGGRFSH